MMIVGSIGLIVGILAQQDADLVLGKERPAWVTTAWARNDPFKDAWKPYAKMLASHPGYVKNTGLPAKAKKLIQELETGPLDANKLYRAAAVYTVARALEWDFDREPLSSPFYGRLSRAWMRFNQPTNSREFCRLGFALCSLRMEFDAGELPEHLLRRDPNDRIVIRGLVSYVRRRPTDPKIIRWALEAAKRLPSLPDVRPQDYLTLALAHGANYWTTRDLKDAIGSRDALKKAMKLVPEDFAKLLQRDLQAVEKVISQSGG